MLPGYRLFNPALRENLEYTQPRRRNNPPTSPLAGRMATKGYQAQAPAMPAAGGSAGSGGGNKAPTGSTPRRGQIKERIIKDVITAVTNLAAGLARADKNGTGTGGLPAAGDADAK
uniref:Uncharacterized protein n=1 Tax=Aegilops tauschii subsp. strangulata TaxID=200361 RepID=A0A452ZAQ4_AEGTS